MNSCSRHGNCILQEGEYTCQCSEGWAGIDCSVRLEMDCNDEIDNDQGITIRHFNFSKSL